MNEFLMRLIAEIENASPKLWSIALAQVQNDVAAKEMWRIPALVVFVVLGIIWVLYAFSSWESVYSFYDNAFGILIFAVFLMAYGFIMYDQLWVQVHMMDSNPDYYAINLLMESAKKIKP